MFALLALGGDVGCSAGPTLAGMVSSLFDGRLQAGILAATVFPALMLLALIFYGIYEKKKKKDFRLPEKDE